MRIGVRSLVRSKHGREAAMSRSYLLVVVAFALLVLIVLLSVVLTI